ncbi:hypothetical protein Pcaca04_26380 [Pectobacterium carotovorum subsp. carotovorum]|nr:hypothetical protein Pcaca04_26380 [Pectobacterium carotovorum subsp. carotovorum]
MSTYFALLTNAGAAKLANAAALGNKLSITEMAVGDGGGVLPTPTPTQTALINETRRAALNMLSVDPANDSQIIAEQVIPESVGGWWIREIGLYDDDGDLVAIANCPETYKPRLQEGSGRVQTVRMILIVSSTDAVTLKIDPSVVLATRKYVDNEIIEVSAEVARNAALLRNIQDLGGADDCIEINHATATNNYSAFLSAIEKRPCRVFFPYTNTGCYKFDGVSADIDLSDVEIIVEPGVYFYTPADNNRNIIRRPGAKINRFTKIQVDGASRFKHGIGSCAERLPAEKEWADVITAGEAHVPQALNFVTDSAATFKLTGAWPNVVFSPTSDNFTIAADYLTFVPPANSFWGVIFPVVTGDTLLASCRDGGTYSCAFVETVSGWVMVRYVSGTRNLAVGRNVNGVFSETDHRWNDGVIAPYRMDKAALGLHVIGPTSVGIVVNGVIILRIETDSAIISAGWANGYNNDGKTCTISDPVLMRGKKAHGLPLVDIVCIGDSTGDRNVTLYSPFDYAKKYYAGMGGGQVARFTNLAASGENSTQQAERLLSTDITGYTFCLIQVGINNIQQQNGVSGFLNDITSMIDYCRTNHVEPIIGIPAMFYTRADIATMNVATDSKGQPSANAERGTLYRLGLMRLCASKNVMLSSSGDAYGVVSPSLLSVINADQIMMDNIHQTAFGSMLMGMAWARSMAAYFVKDGRETKRKDSQAGGRSASAVKLPQRYFSAGGAGDNPQTPVYTVSDDGKLVTLSYYLSRGAAEWANDVIVGKLPARLRPVTDQRFLTQGANSTVIPVGNLVSVIITRDGNIRLLGATNDAYFMPFNITYPI